MKHVSSLVACACTLAFAAAPAWAQDSAKISQSGAGDHAVIEQIATGGNNQASVHQGESWYGGSSGNSAQLMQYGVNSSRIDVMQSGFNNHYQVFQHDGSNLQATINAGSGMYGQGGGDSNTVHIHQSGWDAWASVEQGGSYSSRADSMQHGGEGPNRADIMQSGGMNEAMIHQHTGGNQATIQQMGNNLSASISQQGNGGYGYGYGYGQGNTATIRQGQ